MIPANGSAFFYSRHHGGRSVYGPLVGFDDDGSAMLLDETTGRAQTVDHDL